MRAEIIFEDNPEKESVDISIRNVMSDNPSLAQSCTAHWFKIIAAEMLAAATTEEVSYGH